VRAPHGIVRRTLVGATALGVFAGGVLLVFTLLGVIPVRAYVLQKHELNAGKARLSMLNDRNDALRERVRVLNTDEEMQRLALDQFGMVRPGQKLTVIPGLRTEGSVLDANRTDPIENPAPSATESPKVSRVRAILDAVQFWR
jgi:cell division protein FtsB